MKSSELTARGFELKLFLIFTFTFFTLLFPAVLKAANDAGTKEAEIAQKEAELNKVEENLKRTNIRIQNLHLKSVQGTINSAERSMLQQNMVKKKKEATVKHFSFKGKERWYLAGIMIVFILLLALAVYIYTSLALMKIADRTKTKDGWLAFVPIGNIYLMTKIAKVPGWWTIGVLLGFIPFIATRGINNGINVPRSPRAP